ncbi:MAG: hypothetical protein NTW49_06770 [Bacteroidia bacterium]|nr:hypothetical protein [Bacteroidia bacterium]
MNPKGLILIILLFVAQKGFSQEKKDTLPNKIICWQLVDDFTTMKPVLLDTSLLHFQVFNPVTVQVYNSSGIGNMGHAALPDIYFQRPKSNFYFQDAFASYLFTPENNTWYNTRKPYTTVFYENGGIKSEKEQMIEVLHTQNINKYFNAGLRYRFIHSIGEYSRQETKDNDLGLWIGYDRTRYSVHTTFNYNVLKSMESGGIQNDSVYESGDYQSTLYIPVNLQNAKSSLRVHSLLVSQKLNLGSYVADSTKKETFIPASELNYIIRLQRYTKSFYENPLSGYYRNLNYDTVATADSVCLQTYENTLKWQARPLTIAGLGFVPALKLSNIYEKIYNYKYTLSPVDVLLYNYIAGASATVIFSPSLQCRAGGDYYFKGYKKNDFLFRAALVKAPSANDSTLLTISYDLKNQTPSGYLQHYFSNNFNWPNSQFVRQLTNALNVEFSLPAWHFSILLQAASVRHMIYFDTTGFPVQSTDNNLVFSALLNKAITVGHFHDNLRTGYQSASTGQIRFPAIVLYNSIYYENFFFSKALLTQLGFDVYYNSAFMGYSYVPATGVFCLQNTKKTGDYPVVDVFLNMKIRCVRIFLKLEHANSFMGVNEEYSLIHYPIDKLSFKFGVSWLFYN